MQPDTNETTQEFFARIVQASRERRAPSERNRQIADEVRVNGRTQADVGAEFGLSQRRVSQICQQVDRWYAETEAWERGETCGSVEKHSENEWQKRQLTEIYRRAMRAHAHSEQPLVTRRSRTSGGAEQWSEASEREQRQDTGSLRVALRALEQRARLDTRDEPSSGYTMPQQQKYLLWTVSALSDLRRQAERRGEVAKSAEGSQALVERVVRELLGGTRGEREPTAGTQPAISATPVKDGASVECGVTNAECGTVIAQCAATVGTQSGPGAECAADHPLESSSTSAPQAVETGRSEPPAAECMAASDAAAMSYVEPTDEAVTAQADEKTETRSRARKTAPPPDDDSPERVLAALSRAYGMGMNWQHADRELNEFLLNDYGGQRRWSYSAEQRTALLEWRRVTRLLDRRPRARARAG